VCVTEAAEFVTEAAALAEETGVRRREAERWRAVRVRWFAGMVSLSSLETEKAARGGLFLFLLYKFRISRGANKTAKIL
jgi:hypothetical protein